MASASAGSSRDAGAAPRVERLHAVDTTHLDKLCEKALTAEFSGRHALAAAFFRRAAEEALHLHGETFVCTYLTLRRALSLHRQSVLQGVTREERAALRTEEWALASGCLPLIVRRMDDNTVLPGRGTAAELAFFKRFMVTRHTAFGEPPLSSRSLQLVCLNLGYATALRSASRLLGLLCVRRNVEAQHFVLRVVDCMLPAARSLTEYTLGEEFNFAGKIQQVFAGAFPFDATFVASLRSK